MANYTITRRTETNHNYGCTDFSTIQQEFQVAQDGAALDSTVEWELKADIGYSVNIYDFVFTGATSLVTPIPSPPATSWKDLPSPVLYAQMIQISTTLIRIILYLAPDASQSFFTGGNPFEMPSTDVNTVISIEGCAKIAGHSMRLLMETPTNPNVTTKVDINEDLENNVALRVMSDSTDEVYGILPPTEIDSDEPSTYLMSYQVLAEQGYRYKAPPNLNFTDDSYYTKRRVIKEVNPNDPTKQDIVGVSFDIYKNN